MLASDNRMAAVAYVYLHMLCGMYVCMINERE